MCNGLWPSRQSFIYVAKCICILFLHMWDFHSESNHCFLSRLKSIFSNCSPHSPRILWTISCWNPSPQAGTPAHKLHPTHTHSPGQALNVLIPSDHPPSLADTNTFFRSHATPPLPAPSLALPQHSWSLPGFSSTDCQPLSGKERVCFTQHSTTMPGLVPNRGWVFNT